MGYLINPTALRIGWFQDWNNSFYIENRYYPQLLHIVLKLRIYVLYLLNQPKWRNKKWLYNQLTITSDYAGLHVHIYYYDGKLEEGWRNYTEQLVMYKTVLRKYVNKQYSQKNYRAYLNSLEDFFTIMSILLLYSPLRRSYQIRLNKFMSPTLFKTLPLNKARDKEDCTYRRHKVTKIRMDLYYNLLLNIIQTQLRKPTGEIMRNIKFRGSNMLDVARWYYILYDTIMGARPVLTTLANWMALVFTNMYNIGLKVNIGFYLVSNENITANFLATYIAQRLKQKYRLSILISPLLHELKRVKSITSQRNSNKGLGLKKLNAHLKHNYNLYTHSLRYLFNSYHFTHFQWYSTTATWINYDTLVTHVSVFQHLFNNFASPFLLKDYVSVYNMALRARVFGICRMAHSKRAQILFFVKATYYKLYTHYLLKINKQGGPSQHLRASPDYYIFIREMYYDLYNNFVNLLNGDNFDFIFTNVSKLPVWYSLRIGLKSLAKLQYFRHFVQRHNSIYHIYKISKGTIRRAKATNLQPHKGLIGYKIQLKGRFTRKQIAAKHIFKGGNVPLNTLNSNIDYGFATVPIKNSAVGVKIWLYRGNSSINNSYMIKVV